MSKNLPWFRMYSDFMFDEKVEFLSFEDQRHYVFILCMKNMGLLDKEYPKDGMLDRVVAKRLGLYGEAFESAKVRLMDSGLIDDQFQPAAWEKRQFRSDTDPTAADRKRKQREREKSQSEDVTDASRVTVTDVTRTDIDTDTDTDTEAEAEEQKKNPPSGRKKKSADTPLVTIDDLVGQGVDRQHASDWFVVRKAKKAPLTQTAWDGVKSEAAKARITPAKAVQVSAENNWQGFKAAWYQNVQNNKPGNHHGNSNSGRRESEAERVERINREHDEREHAAGLFSAAAG